MNAFPWDQHMAHLIELLAMPLTYVQVAADLQTHSGLPVTPDMVIGKVRRDGLKKTPPLREKKPALPDPKVDLLKELWLQGRTAQQIGVVLGWTRGAVLGKVHRLRLKGDSKLAGSAAKCVARRVTEIAKSQRPSRIASSASGFMHMKAAAIKPEPIPEMQEEAGAAACSILDLKFDSCRWITGDPTKPLDPIYCGGRATEGPPYCACHVLKAKSKAA